MRVKMIYKCSHPFVVALAYSLSYIGVGNAGIGEKKTTEEQKIAGNEVSSEVQKIAECIKLKQEPYPKIPDEMWNEVGELMVQVLKDGHRPDFGMGHYSNIVDKIGPRDWWNRIQGQRRYAWEESNVAGGGVGNIIQSGDTFYSGAFFVKAEEVHTDPDGKLHNPKGPSIRIGSLKMYHLEGVRISAKIVEFPEHLTLADVETQNNAEIRRIIIKQMTTEKYLTLAGAEVLHMDAHKFNGTRCLYGSKHGKFMQCVCPSTGRVYWLDAPEDCNTCEEVDQFLTSGVWIKGKQLGRT